MVPLGTGGRKACDAEEAGLATLTRPVGRGNGVLNNLLTRRGVQHFGVIGKTASDHHARDRARSGGGEGASGKAGTLEEGTEG